MHALLDPPHPRQNASRPASLARYVGKSARKPHFKGPPARVGELKFVKNPTGDPLGKKSHKKISYLRVWRWGVRWPS